jgi:branched-chain amino acid transport system substrate-binding protein
MRIVNSLRLALLACAALAAPAHAADPVVIGVVLPMTGIFSAYGKPYADGLQIAVDEANKDGGIDGRPLALSIQDSQASNTVAINALNKVLLEKPAVIFGPGMGPPILAMLPTIEKSKIPTIAAPSSSSVTEKGAKYFFRATSSDAVGKEDTTRFLVDKLGKRKIGILYIDSEWGYSARDNITAYLKSLYGLAPVAEATYQPTDKDFTAQIAQMVSAGADAIVTQGYPVDEALIAKQMGQMGVKAAHVGSGTLCNAFTQHLVTTAEVVGQYCGGPAMQPQYSDRPEARAFAETYNKLAGFYPPVYPTQYHDALAMAVAVMRKVGTDPEKLRDGLASTRFEGVMGVYKSDAKGNLWARDVIAAFMPDGTMKEVSHFDAP